MIKQLKRTQIRGQLIHNTSSYFWVRLSRSSSDMSGLKTVIVSYLRRPGGHWGSSLSSTAVTPEPGVIGGSSSPPNPPSKNDPEKSKVWVLIDKVEFFLRNWTRLWDLGNGLSEVMNETSEGEWELRVAGDIKEEEEDDIFIFQSYSRALLRSSSVIEFNGGSSFSGLIVDKEHASCETKQ